MKSLAMPTDSSCPPCRADSSAFVCITEIPKTLVFALKTYCGGISYFVTCNIKQNDELSCTECCAETLATAVTDMLSNLDRSVFPMEIHVCCRVIEGTKAKPRNLISSLTDILTPGN
jgi:hypothetical protein